MASASSMQERLAGILSTSTSPLESLIELEAEVNIYCSRDNVASDAGFLSTYYSSYLISLLLEDDM